MPTTDFADAPVGVTHPELAEEAIEIVSQLRLVSRPETRELLDCHREDTFRARHLEASNPRAVIGALSSAHLIEDSEREMGRVTDWTTTTRAERLIDAMDSHAVYITEAEADAIQTVGATVWLLPTRDVWWQSSDVEPDITGPELRTLHRVRLIDREMRYPGRPDVWRISDRLEALAEIAWEVIEDAR